MSARPDFDNLLDVVHTLDESLTGKRSLAPALSRLVEVLLPEALAVRLYAVSDNEAFLEAATASGSDLLLHEAPLHREALQQNELRHQNGLWVTPVHSGGDVTRLLEVSLDPQEAPPEKIAERVRLAAYLLASAPHGSEPADASSPLSDDTLRFAEALRQTSQTIYHADHPLESLRALCEFTGNVYSRASIALLDDAENPSRLRIVAELAPEGARTDERYAELDDYPGYERLAGRDAVTSANVYNDSSLSEAERARLQSQRIQAFALVPLTVGQRLIGFIWFSHTAPAELPLARLRALQHQADLLAIVLDTKHRLRTTEATLETLNRELRVLESLSASDISDESTWLQRALETALESLGGDEGWLVLFDQRRERATVSAAYPANAERGMPIDLRDNPLFDTILGAPDQPIVVADVTSDPRVTSELRELPGESAEKGLILIAVTDQGQPTGAVILTTRDGERLPEHLDAKARLIGSRIGDGLQKLRLLREAERRATRDARVNAISARMQAASDVEGVLIEAARGLERTLNAGRVAIRLGTLPGMDRETRNGKR